MEIFIGFLENKQWSSSRPAINFMWRYVSNPEGHTPAILVLALKVHLWTPQTAKTPGISIKMCM